jgi:hypothetical protein
MSKEQSELVLYTSADGTIRLDVQLERNAIWLSLNQLAALFGRDKSVISKHLRNIYQEGELDRDATVAKNATVQTEAGRSVVRNIEFFLQSRRRHFRRLPGQLQTRHRVPHLGH